jgi:hypothetical protein
MSVIPHLQRVKETGPDCKDSMRGAAHQNRRRAIVVMRAFGCPACRVESGSFFDDPNEVRHGKEEKKHGAAGML